jgi:ribonuclease P protein component
MNGHRGASRDFDDTSPAEAQAPRGGQPAPFARLKERAEFLAVAKGARMHEAAFTLQAIARDDAGEPGRRFGLTVTKKTGNSVVRNRIRRRLREALRVGALARDEVADGAARDYVIVARRETLSRDFAGLTHDLANAVTRIEKRLRAKPGAQKPQTIPRSKPAD